MGILDLFSKKDGPAAFEIPAGTFTVDRHGNVLSSTLPQSFPPECVAQIVKPVLESFHGAKKAQLALTEIVIQYSALKITARELRGGAMIFLAPHGPQRQT